MTHNPALELANMLQKIRGTARESGLKKLALAAEDGEQYGAVLRRMATLFTGVLQQWSDLESLGEDLSPFVEARSMWTTSVFAATDSHGWGVREVGPDQVATSMTLSTLRMFGKYYDAAATPELFFSTAAGDVVLGDLDALDAALDVASVDELHRELCRAKIATVRGLVHRGPTGSELPMALAALLVAVFMTASSATGEDQATLVEKLVKLAKDTVKNGASSAAYDAVVALGTAGLRQLGVLPPA